MMRHILSVAALLAAGTLAACGPTSPEKPAFYVDMSSPGARFDAVSARDMINAYRIKEGLPAVNLDPALTAAAEQESIIVSRRAASTGKVTPDNDLEAKVRAAGYPVGGMRRNVSAGYYTIAEAFSGWRESDQHRRTLLMEDATDMGIAAIHQPRAKYKVYWTLIMARREK